MNTHDHHHFFRARMVVVEQAGSSCRRSRHGRRSSSVAPQSSSTGMLKQNTECKAKFRKQIKSHEGDVDLPTAEEHDCQSNKQASQESFTTRGNN
jgi:hypothetical protein